MILIEIQFKFINNLIRPIRSEISPTICVIKQRR